MDFIAPRPTYLRDAGFFAVRADLAKKELVDG
jgi:hypothetical protein